MSRRIITAVLLLSLVFLGFRFDSLGWLVIGAAALIAWLCTLELMCMLKLKGLRVYRRVATIGVLLLMFEAVATQMAYSVQIFGLAVCFAWIVRMREEVPGAWGDVSATCFTLAYIGIPMAAITRVFMAGGEAQSWLLLMLGIIWATDTFALFVGKAFGRTRLWPKISPGKTWEGSAGGLLGALAVVFVARALFPGPFAQVQAVELVLFAVCFSIIGQLGDLAESLLKRDVGVKDSGSPFTGHGGFLDLMDAVLFSAVPLLVYLELFQPHLLG